MADTNVAAEPTADEIREARTMGWRPQEEYKGRPEDFVDARTYLEKGRQILPIVNKHNERLSAQVTELQARLDEYGAAIKAANATIAGLEEARAANLEEEIEETRQGLIAQLTTASEAGDHKLHAELTDKLTQFNAKVLAAQKRDDKADKADDKDKGDEGKPTLVKLPKEIIEWFDQHPTYKTDQRRAALASTIAQELRKADPSLKGAALLDAAAAETERMLHGDASEFSKVDSGNGGSGRGNGGGDGGKTYADLPADAKAACEKQALRVVGPGKAHKDLASWRNRYAELYFKE